MLPHSRRVIAQVVPVERDLRVGFFEKTTVLGHHAVVGKEGGHHVYKVAPIFVNGGQ